MVFALFPALLKISFINYQGGFENKVLNLLNEIQFRIEGLLMRTLSVLLLFIILFSLTACNSVKKEDPNEKAVKEAFSAFVSALNDKNWQNVWDGLSKKSQDAFTKEGYKRMQEIVEAMPPEIRTKKIESLNMTNNDILKMAPDKFFVFVMEKTQDSQEFSDLPISGEVASITITSLSSAKPSSVTERAVIKIKDKLEEAVMVKQDGVWKMEFED